MALDNEFLPAAQNSNWAPPKEFANIGLGAKAPAGFQLPAEFLNIAPQAPVPETGVIPSVKRGAANTFASLSNLVGADETALAAQEYAAQFPKEIPDIQSVKSLADLGTFAVESGAENLANLLAIVGTGAVTAMTGGGFVAGAVGANFLLQAGESKQAIEAEGGEVNPLTVGAPAIINTAMDSLSLLKLAKVAGVLSKVSKHMDEAATTSGIGGRALEGLKAGGTALAVEGSTESAQTYTNMVAARLAADKEVRAAFAVSGNDIDELVNAFAAGGLGAAVTVGPMATVFRGSSADNTSSQKGEAAPTAPTEVNTQTGQTATPTVSTGQTQAPTFTAGDGDATAAPEVPEVPPSVFVDTLKAAVSKQIADLEAYGADAIPASARTFGTGVLNRTDQEILDYTNPGDRYTDVVVTSKDGSEITMQGLFSGAAANTYSKLGDLTTDFGDLKTDLILETIESFRIRFMPNSSVVVSNTKTFLPSSQTTKALAFMQPLTSNGKRVFNISLNAERLREMANLTGDVVGGGLMETLSHEFGHAISYESFVKESPAVKAAVYKEYQAWLDKVGKQTWREYLKGVSTASIAKYYNDTFKDETLDSNAVEIINKVGKVNYFLSFDEYFADQFARYASKDKTFVQDLSPESRKFWKRIFDRLAELYKELKGSFAPNTTFKKWLELRKNQSALEILQSLPVESTKVPDSVMALMPEEIKQLNTTFKSLIEDGSRAAELAKTMGFSEKQVTALKASYRTSTGFTRKIAGTFLTPAQIAERYNVPAAKAYMAEVYKYYQTKMQGISAADAVSKEWMSLPQAKADNLGRFIYEVSELSDKYKRKLTPAEMQELRDKHQIDAGMAAIYGDMQGTFDSVIDRLEDSLIKDIARNFTDKPDDFVKTYKETTDPIERTKYILSFGIQDIASVVNALNAVKKQFESLRNRNYFPRMRFGAFTLTLKQKRTTKTGKEVWEVTSFETYESKKERDKAYAEAQREFDLEIKGGNASLQVSTLDDTTRSLYGMPQLVVDRIESAMRQTTGGLTAEQKQALTDISLDLSPGKRYLQHMKKRKNTPGFSTEALRTYAAYMSNASNHLARVEHTADMVEQLKALRAAQKGVQGDVTDLAELESYYTDHFKYLLNPENDWAKLRAFGFLWYLGFNVKSAMVNMTQLPMVTYPFLAARYGDLKATGALSKAMADVVTKFKNKEKFSEIEQRLLDRLTQEGVIDESMASELAGLSEGTALSRIMPTNTAHRVVTNFNYYGAYMFGIAEKYNRRVTALATFRMQMEANPNFEEAYNAAKDAIHKSQFEYAKYNRPEFMRGKKSAFFLFYNYTQQFMYLITAGARTPEARKTAMRMLAMLLLMAGLQGLPFAEYILSTLDLLGTNIKKWTGMENPKVDLRNDMRELFDDLGMNPDLMMHGAGRYLGAGPLKLLEMFGVPVPNLDITGSISMGEPLPGLRMNDLKGDPKQQAGQLLLNGLGPIPNIALTMWDGMTSTDPDRWKNIEKALPVALKNLSKASRLAVRGEETSRGGATFLPYDGENPYEAGELVAQAMGFTATRLSQKRELYGEQMSTSLYWTERRQLLMERYAYAVKTRDRETMRSTMEDIKEFNSSLTKPSLKPYRLNRATLKKSLNTKMRTLEKRERGLPTTDKDRLIYSELEAIY